LDLFEDTRKDCHVGFGFSFFIMDGFYMKRKSIKKMIDNVGLDYFNLMKFSELLSFRKDFNIKAKHR
jgi:hypothetical protein